MRRNVPLYIQVADALEAAWPKDRQWRLLDVGCGDGANLLPGLRRRAGGGGSGGMPMTVDLLEPSEALLAPAREAAAQLGPAVACTAHLLTLQVGVSGCCACFEKEFSGEHADGIATVRRISSNGSRNKCATKSLSTPLPITQRCLPRQQPRMEQKRWDVCQSTFALQNLGPASEPHTGIRAAPRSDSHR